MTNDERKIIEKGVRAYSTLTIAEKEIYDKLRQDYMLSLYKDMPSDIRSHINEYLDSLAGNNKEFYQGYIAAMDWYRGLSRYCHDVRYLSFTDVYYSCQSNVPRR
jgi:hypothetical protein